MGESDIHIDRARDALYNDRLRFRWRWGNPRNQGMPGDAESYAIAGDFLLKTLRYQGEYDFSVDLKSEGGDLIAEKEGFRERWKAQREAEEALERFLRKNIQLYDRTHGKR